MATTKTKEADSSTTDETKTGMQHFDGTISKIDSEGRLVASSYVDYDNGEKLTSDVSSEEISDAQVATSKAAKEETAAQVAEATGSDPASVPDKTSAAAPDSGDSGTKAVSDPDKL
jgi:hypothetical protein